MVFTKKFIFRSIIPGLLFLSGAVIYSYISLFRHNHFASNGYDLGIFDQAIWGYSRFEIIFNTVRMVPNLLGDHFHPILMLLAPAYWLWNDVKMLLVLQAILAASAVIPLYLWAKAKIGIISAVIISISYLSFWGILAGVLYDFHEISVAVPLIAWALYAVVTRKNKLFWVIMMLALLTKENIALTFIAVGIYMVVAQKRWRLGLAVIAVAIAWFLAVLKVIIPALSKAKYSYWSYTALGPDPLSALMYVISHPIESLKSWYVDPTKNETLQRTFKTWLVLPLLSPLVIIALPTLAERFWSSNRYYWGTDFQYSMIIAPILAFATVDSMSRIGKLIDGKYKKYRKIVFIIISVMIFLAGFHLNTVKIKPLQEMQSYMSTLRASEIKGCLAAVPDNVSVSATSALIPHLSHRKNVYGLHVNAKQEYLVADTSASVWPLTNDKVNKILAEARRNGYRDVCIKNQTAVLKQS